MSEKLIARNEAYGSVGGEECSSEADTEFDRQFPRTEFRGSALAIIYPLDKTSAENIRCTVLMRDFSHSGFGIAHTEMLIPGQRIELQLGPKRLLGLVQWCRPTELGFYIIGCRIATSP